MAGDLDGESLRRARAEARDNAEVIRFRLEQARLQFVKPGNKSLCPDPSVSSLLCSAFARLRAQLASQPVIDQANGILMARSGCDPDEAFDILRRASQRSQVKVRELAADVVAGP
jgi:hypothetical protein